MPSATPPPGKSKTSTSLASPPSDGVNVMVSLPAPGTTKSSARYWSPKAWRPMMIGFVHPGTRRGMFSMTIGSRKMTPPRMLRMVPLGERYIRLSPNSSTRASSGVIVAHFTPTPCSLMALAASTVIWSSVASRDSMPRSKYFSSMSRYGVISWSLMNDQMIRVISSPSSSTTGFFTLICAMRRRRLSALRYAARKPVRRALLAQRPLVLDAPALPAGRGQAVRAPLRPVPRSPRAAQRPRARSRVEGDLAAQQADRAAAVGAQPARAGLRQMTGHAERPARLRGVPGGINDADAHLVRARAERLLGIPLDDLPTIVAEGQLRRDAQPVD